MADEVSVDLARRCDLGLGKDKRSSTEAHEDPAEEWRVIL